MESRFDMEKQVHFIPFNIEDKFPFRLEFIEKTVFKNTYFQITYLKFKGRINTPNEQQLLSYFIEKNIKKFPNASYKHYEQLPKMEKLERDN